MVMGFTIIAVALLLVILRKWFPAAFTSIMKETTQPFLDEQYRIPHALAGKFPARLLFLLSMRSWGEPFMFALAVFFIYGPIVGPPDHNGFRYLLAPWVCPIVPALCYLLVPFKPYGRWERYDERDPDMKRLLELFRSQATRRFLLRATIKLSGGLFVTMALITMVVRKSLNWSFPSPWLVQGILSCCLSSWLVLNFELVNWGLKNWISGNRSFEHVT